MKKIVSNHVIIDEELNIINNTTLSSKEAEEAIKRKKQYLVLSTNKEKSRIEFSISTLEEVLNEDFAFEIIYIDDLMILIKECFSCMSQMCSFCEHKKQKIKFNEELKFVLEALIKIAINHI